MVSSKVRCIRILFSPVIWHLSTKQQYCFRKEDTSLKQRHQMSLGCQMAFMLVFTAGYTANISVVKITLFDCVRVSTVISL